ncbi:hypothetical protein D046_1586B, partial [Vibrio parahaemolyticus V-223/04]
RMQ